MLDMLTYLFYSLSKPNSPLDIVRKKTRKKQQNLFQKNSCVKMTLGDFGRFLYIVHSIFTRYPVVVIPVQITTVSLIIIMKQQIFHHF